MKGLFLIVLLLAAVAVLDGCTYQMREPVALVDPFYTRGEVDAINAEQNCRAMARSLLQAQRCGVRR